MPRRSVCISPTCPKSSHHPADNHLRNAKRSRLDDRANGNDGAANYDLTGSPEDIARPDCDERTDEAAEHIDRCHRTLDGGRRVAHGFEKVLSDDDIAKDALRNLISIGYQDLTLYHQ
jgi:hypothetical protein